MPHWWFFGLLLGWVVVHGWLTAVGPLKRDDAEQIVLSQQFRAGYDMQPPLYTWIFWSVSQVVGPGMICTALVRSSLLLACCLFLYLSARRVLDERRWFFASAGVVVLPVIGWDIVQQLTHTLLLCTACAATVYAALRVLQRGNAVDFALLGLTTGLGVLAKYNYLVFAFAMIAALVCDAELRRRLRCRHLALAMGIMAGVLTPHALWALEHRQVLYELLAGRVGINETASLLTNLSLACQRLGLNVLLTIAPLIVAGLVCSCRLQASGNPADRFLSRLWLMLAGSVLALAACGVTKFHPRWLTPFMVGGPLWLMLRAPRDLPRWRLACLNAVVLGLLGASITARVLIEQVLHIRVDHGRDLLRGAAAQELRKTGFERGIIVADTYLLAGRARIEFPNALVFKGAASAGFQDPVADSAAGSAQVLPVLLLWAAEQGPLPPARLCGDEGWKLLRSNLAGGLRYAIVAAPPAEAPVAE